MGREYREFKVVCSLSSHNSEQDDLDDADYQELYERVVLIAAEHKYNDISPMVM